MGRREGQKKGLKSEIREISEKRDRGDRRCERKGRGD